jgi:hypothetical protein
MLLWLAAVPLLLLVPLAITRLFPPPRRSRELFEGGSGQFSAFTYQYYQAGRWLKRFWKPCVGVSLGLAVGHFLLNAFA